jgi:hypothetical protein
VIQEMSWQMHYNQGDQDSDLPLDEVNNLPPLLGADLFTYMLNPEVFSVKHGHVDALTGTSANRPFASFGLCSA